MITKEEVGRRDVAESPYVVISREAYEKYEELHQLEKLFWWFLDAAERWKPL